MWTISKMRNRKGFAMVFVVLIALAMIIPAMILASNAVSRRKVISGEAVSDRALSVADATIDKILNKINTFNFTFTTPTIINSDGDVDTATKEAQDYLIGYYISKINGGVPSSSDPTGSLATIKKSVSTFLYNFSNQHYYVVWDSTNNNVAPVSTVGPDGDIKTKEIKDLSTGDIYNNILAIDPEYKTDNMWAEIDVRADYVADQWIINDTAYLLSRPNVKRTIQAVAERGQVVANGGELANGNWYTRSETTQDKTVYFSDFSGLYHTKVYFGQFETTRGPIRSDSSVYMGGWAYDPVYAHNRVYDYAIDDGWAHDGRFGPDKKSLWWAKNNGYAVDGYPQADWPNGDAALFGSAPFRDPTDPNGGLQDKAFDQYYVNGDATIVFSVVTDADGNKVGKVTINGNTYDMPSNGAIFVDGDATVSGTIKGRCSVGASDDIYIGGNIVYEDPPRIDKDTPIPPGYTPDALGLIAYDDILIPGSTFNVHHHLEIDAAMLSVHGSFGVTSDVPWHRINGSGEYEAWWNGCQAEWSTDNAPAIVSGNWVKGYDIQHTNYDWNLYDYGAPPFYPATNSRTETEHSVRYKIVTDAGLLNHLRSLTKDQLTPISSSAPDYNPDYPYKYTYNGVTYYYGTHFSFGATAYMRKTALYRISWKEQIANPVKPEP